MVVLEAAALLHDFGKIGIEEDILCKPEDLVGSERSEVEKHVLRGYYILSGFAEFDAALEGIRTHHEHYNGMGYPYGLSNSSIPLIGRLLSVVDAYDAMTSDRPYRKAQTKKDAIKILRDKAGTQFDPEVVKIFIKIIKE
jgi:HD-GYP domain-containing protein (c-di-GMP phosphodiesterase class II)